MIRPATPADVEAIHRIYAPYVRETIISFELEVPSVDEMRARFEKITTPIRGWSRKRMAW